MVPSFPKAPPLKIAMGNKPKHLSLGWTFHFHIITALKGVCFRKNWIRAQVVQSSPSTSRFQSDTPELVLENGMVGKTLLISCVRVKW
jgi:hypothetical protein